MSHRFWTLFEDLIDSIMEVWFPLIVGIIVLLFFVFVFTMISAEQKVLSYCLQQGYSDFTSAKGIFYCTGTQNGTTKTHAVPAEVWE